MMKRIRRYLIAGLLVWLPLYVTYVLVTFFAGLMDKSIALLPPNLRPEAWWGEPLPYFGVVLTIVLIFVTGVLTANIVGRRVVGGWESLLERIPFVRSIYSASKNFAEIVFADSDVAFSKVLLVEYPRKGLYTLTFQTATEVGEIQAQTGEDVVACFVPSTPNPTTGYIIMVPRADTIELDMSVEDAIKFVMSLGVVVPKWTPQEARELPLKLPEGDT